VRLLVDHREDLVAERTRIISRLRWHLHELDLGLAAERTGARPAACAQPDGRPARGPTGHRRPACSRARRAAPPPPRRDQRARRRDHSAGGEARALTGCDLRLRSAHRSQDPRRDRRR
jgi:hypothetical protein